MHVGELEGVNKIPKTKKLLVRVVCGHTQKLHMTRDDGEWHRAVSACGNQHTWVGDSGVIRAGARGEDDQVWELAVALDLERVPHTEQVHFLLLVLEKVDNEVDGRCCCVELAVERVPDGGDEVARARLGSGVVAQGELDARDGIGGVPRECVQVREYRCIMSLEKRESSAWATRRHV